MSEEQNKVSEEELNDSSSTELSEEDLEQVCGGAGIRPLAPRP